MDVSEELEMRFIVTIRRRMLPIPIRWAKNRFANLIKPAIILETLRQMIIMKFKIQ